MCVWCVCVMLYVCVCTYVYVYVYVYVCVCVYNACFCACVYVCGSLLLAIVDEAGSCNERRLQRTAQRFKPS